MSDVSANEATTAGKRELNKMKSSQISSLRVIFAFLFYSVQGQDLCSTPTGGSGQCISVRSCPSLLKILLNPKRTNEDVQLLKRSQCGYKTDPLVCCPNDTGCITPDGIEAQCVGVYSCPSITRLLTAPISEEVKTFIKKSRCKGPELYSVCCGPDVTTVKPNPNRSKCDLTSAPPDQQSGCCGVDTSSGNKIFGGNVTAIDEYPWLVVIEYRGIRDNKIKLLCGGSLISGRYVLTAAHCVTGPVMNVGIPINVRVGDYDTQNSGPDCVEVEGGGSDCTDGAQIIPVEEVIPHEGYDPKSQLRRDDIALIRLKEIVPYTDFIRPICLPTIDISKGEEKQTLYAAGWGAVSEFQSSSNIKLQVDLPLVTIDECQPSYNVSNRKVKLWDGQLCAGGEKGKDSCKGDSGGPLMSMRGNRFDIIGVVSFGPTPCGIEDVPGVYSKVFTYLPWIRSKIRP